MGACIWLVSFMLVLCGSLCDDVCQADMICPGDGAVNYLMIGNPGVGKSTLLNGFTSLELFDKWVSFGQGLTKFLQAKKVGKDVYMDTPGLNDMNMRKQAAQEITKALRRGGVYKIFFVITLEAGRIKPADVTTMKLVLEAAVEIKDYAVIINKMEEYEIEMIMQNQDYAQDRVIAGLMSSLPTKSVTFEFLPRLSDLAGKSNRVPDMNKRFHDFIFNAPTVNISTERVDDIKADLFEEVKESLEKHIQSLNDQNEKLMRQMEADFATYQTKMQELEARAAARDGNHHLEMMQVLAELEKTREELIRRPVIERVVERKR